MHAPASGDARLEHLQRAQLMRHQGTPARLSLRGQQGLSLGAADRGEVGKLNRRRRQGLALCVCVKFRIKINDKIKIKQ